MFESFRTPPISHLCVFFCLFFVQNKFAERAAANSEMLDRWVAQFYRSDQQPPVVIGTGTGVQTSVSAGIVIENRAIGDSLRKSQERKSAAAAAGLSAHAPSQHKKQIAAASGADDEFSRPSAAVDFNASQKSVASAGVRDSWDGGSLRASSDSISVSASAAPTPAPAAPAPASSEHDQAMRALEARREQARLREQQQKTGGPVGPVASATPPSILKTGGAASAAAATKKPKSKALASITDNWDDEDDIEAVTDDEGGSYGSKHKPVALASASDVKQRPTTTAGASPAGASATAKVDDIETIGDAPPPAATTVSSVGAGGGGGSMAGFSSAGGAGGAPGLARPASSTKSGWGGSSSSGGTGSMIGGGVSGAGAGAGSGFGGSDEDGKPRLMGFGAGPKKAYRPAAINRAGSGGSGPSMMSASSSLGASTPPTAVGSSELSAVGGLDGVGKDDSTPIKSTGPGGAGGGDSTKVRSFHRPMTGSYDGGSPAVGGAPVSPAHRLKPDVDDIGVDDL